MQKKEPLIFASYYRIFNKGINGCKLFYQNKNYDYFLNLFKKNINPIAGTSAWCLMPNLFHLLVRIKEIEEVNSRKV